MEQQSKRLEMAGRLVMRQVTVIQQKAMAVGMHPCEAMGVQGF